MTRPPPLDPGLLDRAMAVVVLGLALFALSLMFGCGAAPTAPKADPCIHADTLIVRGWMYTITAYYSPPCPEPK